MAYAEWLRFWQDVRLDPFDFKPSDNLEASFNFAEVFEDLPPMSDL